MREENIEFATLYLQPVRYDRLFVVASNHVRAMRQLKAKGPPKQFRRVEFASLSPQSRLN